MTPRDRRDVESPRFEQDSSSGRRFSLATALLVELSE
jgi:hypothetical protein